VVIFSSPSCLFSVQKVWNWLEHIAEKFMSRHRIAGQSHCVKAANKSLEKVAVQIPGNDGNKFKMKLRAAKFRGSACYYVVHISLVFSPDI
jgi:hypothetical protein